MADDPRLNRLVDEMLDTEATPEEVCSTCPEMLPEVYERWRQIRDVRAELDEMFPTRQEATVAVQSLSEATALPRILGYEIESMLGRGGMGVVFRARHLRLDRVVALKMVLAGAYAGALERERFQREAEAAARLCHPNVVQIHDIGVSDGRPYFTMELVEGGNLAEKLQGAPHAARQAAGLVATLAGAVEAAHQSGIVHRDLKPANVLLTADGTPKISDFGLARRLDGAAQLTRSGDPIGTPSYMAPEQARGRTDEIGPAADIYALGAILYEMLTGRPPFTAESATDTIFQVIHQEPAPPSRLHSNVPRDLETICLKCLFKEPRLRYATAGALADDLNRFLRGEAITARPERTLEWLARRLRQRPALAMAIAAGLLVVGFSAGAWVWVRAENAAAQRKSEAEQAAMESAVDADLRQMVDFLKRSAWPEAKESQERAKARLGDHESPVLRSRLDQGARDLHLALRLEEIHVDHARNMQTYLLRRAREYEEALHEAGFGQVGDDPEATAERVRASNIRSALVAALDYWCGQEANSSRKIWALTVARRADPDPTGWRDRARDPAVWADQAALVKVVESAAVADQPVPLLLALAKHLNDDGERLLFLLRIQQAHPGDFWANLTLGSKLTSKNTGEAIRYFQAAVAIQPRRALGYHQLGFALILKGQFQEAVEQLRWAVDLDPAPNQALHMLVLSLSKLSRHDEAIERLQAAVGRNPNDALLHTRLGEMLEAKGLHAGAFGQHQQAVGLDPHSEEAQRGLRNYLIGQGRLEEARGAWQKAIDANSGRYAFWDGFAAMCLFLGREDDFRLARQTMLARFSAVNNSYTAGWVSVECLLLPATQDELRQIVALAERAKAEQEYPFWHFVQGMAAYRQGRFDKAIAALLKAEDRALGAAPRLVLAMALHRNGQAEEARKTLAAAVMDDDWKANQARNRKDWICHVLRREAENWIEPKLP
jgi:eukaryotic-like serine/threonine-protein kinase